jgi:predicted NAD/FAD-dependent oxidoreductase
MSNKIVIIGAGFSAAVFSVLIQGSDLKIFDKGRGPGGRSSTRRVDNIGIFDHGLQFINSENKEFINFLKKNLSNWIKEWNGDFVDFDKNKKLPKSNKYIGINGNNDFVKKLISVPSNYNKELLKISKDAGKWLLEFADRSQEIADILVLTIPMEQCKNITQSLNINFLFKGSMEPNITTMIAFESTKSIKTSGYLFKTNNILAWAANESSKSRDLNADSLQLWTLQSSKSFANDNCKNFKIEKLSIMNYMIKEFSNILDISAMKIIHKDAHSWLYAYKKDLFEKEFFWDEQLKLGICGDWMCGSKAEDSWRSASMLANQINNS